LVAEIFYATLPSIYRVLVDVLAHFQGVGGQRGPADGEALAVVDIELVEWSQRGVVFAAVGAIRESRSVGLPGR